MDFTKFVSLLVTKKLFFCRSDHFEDPFEGSYSKANIALRPQIYKDMPKEQLDTMLTTMSNFSRWVRGWTYINCWHANEHESAAMWKLYAQTNEAVAIETDYQQLATVLPENVYLGLVNYINYETDWLPEGNGFYPFTHKRTSFEHEMEVRAVVQDLPTTETGIQMNTINPLTGIQVDIDVASLVKCVHVSPTSPDWFHNIVQETSKKFEFAFDVKRSNLYSEPVF